MSCNTCLNSEKQPLRCVFDENGKSLQEYLDEINASIKKLNDVVFASIDGKGLSGTNMAELLQSVINKVTATPPIEVLKTQFITTDNQSSTLQEALYSILKRIEILEKNNIKKFV